MGEGRMGRAGFAAVAAAGALVLSACGGSEEVVIPTAAPTTPAPVTTDPGPGPIEPAGDEAAFLEAIKTSGGPAVAVLSDEDLVESAQLQCDTYAVMSGPEDPAWAAEYQAYFTAAIGDGATLDLLTVQDLLTFYEELHHLSTDYFCPEYSADARIVTQTYHDTYAAWDGQGAVPLHGEAAGPTEPTGPTDPTDPPASGEGVETSVFDVKVGDCIDSRLSTSEFLDYVTVVECTQEHDYEVYASLTIEGDTFPGEDAIFDQADDFCHAEFQTFMGIPYEESIHYFSYWYPVEDSWNFFDDREVLCLIETDEFLTGSLQGAAE